MSQSTRTVHLVRAVPRMKLAASILVQAIRKGSYAYVDPYAIVLSAAYPSGDNVFFEGIFRGDGWRGDTSEKVVNHQER